MNTIKWKFAVHSVNNHFTFLVMVMVFFVSKHLILIVYFIIMITLFLKYNFIISI